MFSFQFPIYIMLVVVIVGEILLRRWRFFRQSYFIGGNERSARLSGINVDRVKILNYVLMGVLAALTGLLVTGRMGTASVSAGQGVELQVISACVIGGASLAGGEGSVLGSLLGVILMALILNGLNLLGINPYWQTIVVGGVLVLTAAADALSRRRGNVKVARHCEGGSPKQSRLKCKIASSVYRSPHNDSSAADHFDQKREYLPTARRR